MAEAQHRIAKDAWVLRVLDINVQGGATGFKENGAATQAALAVWQTARADVVKQLGALGHAIQSGDDPESSAAIDLISTLVDNLLEQPDTVQRVDELEGYLITDDVIDAAEMPSSYGPTLRIRAPLLQALGDVKRALSN